MLMAKPAAKCPTLRKRIRNQRTRVARGGYDAGHRIRNLSLDHHTIIVNRLTGGHISGLYLSHRPPEFAPSAAVYEVSSHPVPHQNIIRRDE